MKKNTKPWIIASLIALAVAYCLWVWTDPSRVQDEVSIGGPFALVNQDGKLVTDADYEDRLKLVYFGFTYCPDVCPTDLSVIAQAMQQLSAEEAVQVVPLFITIDPERDNVQQLRDYLANFKPRIEGLTGDRAAVDAVIKAYKVYAQKVPSKDGKDYTMDHSAFLYLMSRDGKYLTHFAHNSSPAVIATTIRSYL